MKFLKIIRCSLAKQLTSIAIVLLLAGCTASRPPEISPLHLEVKPSQVIDDIPAIVAGAPVLPPPKPQPKLETFTVVVNDVPANELLFSLARDAKLNIDIHPDIEGSVSLNAISQTLKQILDRIAKQISLRYHLDGATLVLEPDKPYWHTYSVDYVNMARDTSSEVGVATEISTAGGSVSGDSTTSSGNISNTRVSNVSSNHFWEVVENNILSIVSDAEEGGGTSESDTTSPVVVNAVSGVISVYAPDYQQREVQAFLDKVLASALRQVLIEMTIVEVELGDRFQAGVDWQYLANANTGLTAVSAMTGSNLSTPPVFSLNYQDVTASGKSYAGTLKILEAFGDVKVLSSPKIMALNNQTALLKVVDEKVYFSVDLEIERNEEGNEINRTYSSEIHTIPVGLVMSVTPQINDVDNITLNIRPTISRITGYAVDPAPRLANSSFDNLIPEIQVREMESLLQISNGQMVVMGGLMQNKTDEFTQSVPFFSKLPLIGDLFKYQDDEYTKSELVIFLRPTVIKGAGANMNLQAYENLLPKSESSSKAAQKELQ